MVTTVRQSRPNETSTAAGINETEEPQVAGGVSTPGAQDEGCKKAVMQVKEAFEVVTHCRPSNFTAVICSTQTVAGRTSRHSGINYFAKVADPCVKLGLADLRIYKSSGEDASAILTEVA